MRASPRDLIASAACLVAVLAGTNLTALRAPAGPIPSAARDHAHGTSRVPSAGGAGDTAPEAAAEIRNLLDGQATAWNRGDEEGFLAGYWNSEETAFAGPQGILHGWHALVERYRKNYPDRKAMGTLEFSGLEITPLCPDAALVLGHWHLERESGPIGGVFSLVLRHFPEGWRIVVDHTSAVPAATFPSP